MSKRTQELVRTARKGLGTAMSEMDGMTERLTAVRSSRRGAAMAEAAARAAKIRREAKQAGRTARRVDRQTGHDKDQSP